MDNMRWSRTDLITHGRRFYESGDYRIRVDFKRDLFILLFKGRRLDEYTTFDEAKDQAYAHKRKFKS